MLNRKGWGSDRCDMDRSYICKKGMSHQYCALWIKGCLIFSLDTKHKFTIIENATIGDLLCAKRREPSKLFFHSYSYYYTHDTIVHEPSDEVTDEAFFHSLPWFTLLLHFFLTLFALMVYSRYVYLFPFLSPKYRWQNIYGGPQLTHRPLSPVMDEYVYSNMKESW